jgi:adenine-specific DNA methylase
MSEQPIQDSEEKSSLKPLAIEGKLPLKAVGIENLREANPRHLPPHRYLHPWFARRPTPASRLAVLASVLPKETNSDDLLRWMQIGPSQGVENESISEYVERKKATEDDRNGTLGEHYGYPRPFTQSPSESERKELHETLRKHWDGQLPSLLDPTAGGGVIPFESLRYGLPTKANELNPIPSVILKVLLEYVPTAGAIESDVLHWADKINNKVEKRLSRYFPPGDDGLTPENYISTYKVTCPTCGSEIPLVPKWWIRTASGSDDVVVKPHLENGKISYECRIEPSDEFLEGFDPGEGPVKRGGDVECLDCNVVTESEELQKRLKQGEFEYDVYCVRTVDDSENYSYRSPNKNDREAIKKAREQINSDFELSTLLSTEIPSGEKTHEIRRYGFEEWRDIFSPRQLVTHYEYLQAVRYVKPEIEAEYEPETAEAVITLLTLAASKCIDRNSRLTDWDTNWGYPSRLFKGKNYSVKRVFVDNNLSVGAMGFESQIERIVGSYEDLRSYLPDETPPAEVTNLDAAELPYDDDSLSSVIIDPPYYTSVMYAELSDVFYVWLKEYLGDIFPEFFSSKLTDKENEAVANPSKFDGVAGDSSSKKQLANDFYEKKMSNIFSELYRVLESGGVMTVMFTHKETDAWDTLTMSLINSGFIITSTHPITSEMPQRANMRSSASADSTLLLTGRKPHTEQDPDDAIPTLWNDVKSDTRKAAKEAARELLESGLSLTKTDVIISTFGPTLRVFADAYPVVDDEDNEVPPRRALEEAREAVTQVLVDEYLDTEGIDDLDDVTEWYILCWLVHEAETFSYDEGRQLGLGIGVDIDEIKRSTKTWRKNRGDIKLRGHDGRVQNINEKPENRSSRTPVNPDDLSFSLALDKVHAAMHVYDVQGESACCDWLRERNFDSDPTFKATLKALLQVLPHDHEDWVLARDLAVGRTRDVLDLDFSPNVFAENSEQTQQTGIDDY